MTDREKLAKIIKEYPCLYISHHEMASYLIANGVTVQEWISVEDRLPEDGLVVLLGYTSNKSVIAGYLDYKCMEWYDYADMPVARPTHWKSLSEPPKEVSPK